MVIIRQKPSYLKNLRNVVKDIGNFIDVNAGTPIYVSVLTKKPKLIVSEGFFYYTNGQLVTNKLMYIYYKEFLERMDALKFTLIVECDTLNTNKLYSMNMRIVDCFNNISSLNYENIHTILLNTLYKISNVNIGYTIRLPVNAHPYAIQGNLKFLIEKKEAISIIIRTSNSKDDLKHNKLDSYLFEPTTKFSNGRIKITFMLNEKPIL